LTNLKIPGLLKISENTMKLKKMNVFDTQYSTIKKKFNLYDFDILVEIRNLKTLEIYVDRKNNFFSKYHKSNHCFSNYNNETNVIFVEAFI
jgi:hypothetical protein